ncbi:PilZ domain-containing protein [Sphingomonas sp. Tas61C01]|uniref:PilZ domain-containing protein n=1 Tax=Sphingomonas sp. Tas61C01 TaxID=3458297 RepID=UPI00403EA333
MALAAKLYRDERTADRQPVSLDATLRKPDQRPVDILIEDLSAGGFRMTTIEALSLGDAISVGISGIGRREARVVRRSGSSYGCEFDAAVAVAEIERAQTVETIVHADFGTVPAGIAGDPALDPFEQRIRRLRGPILAVATVAPWVAIGAVAHAVLR